ARHQDAVAPPGMPLQVPDRPPLPLDDPRRRVVAREPLLHLGARERLVVPVAGDLGIRVPGDEPVDVVGAGRPQRRQSSAYANVHSTSSCEVPPALRYSAFAGSLSGSVSTNPTRVPRSRASPARRASKTEAIPRRRWLSATSTS